MVRPFLAVRWDADTIDDCRQLIRLAVREDLDRQQDWTTVALVDAGAQGAADVVARTAGIAAGIEAAALVAEEYDPRIEFTAETANGADIAAGQRLATLRGPARSLLACERPLLNMLGHLCGIATTTRRYVEAIAGTSARIYDTRKTMPGWRRLEKLAVSAGGGMNHRVGLFDAVLIKDNHLALAAGGGASAPAARDAVLRVREFLASQPAGAPEAELIVEVEVDSLAGLREVLAANPDLVLLDNMPPAMLREAVQLRGQMAPGVELEASGGISLQTVRMVAETGVERISSGALTHSAAWLDVGLDWRRT